MFLSDFDGTMTNQAGSEVIFKIDEKGNIVDYADFYASLYEGCKLFLMSRRGQESYKISDKNHLYLYKETNNKAFYCIQEDGRNKEYNVELSFQNEQFNNEQFNSAACDNKQLVIEIFDITSKRGHTLFGDQLVYPRHHYADLSLKFKSRDKILEIMAAHLKEGDPRRMNKHAKFSLKEMIRNDMPIVIISKNRQEYIYALLEYEGFTEFERNRMSVLAPNNKYDGAKYCIQQFTKGRLNESTINDIIKDVRIIIVDDTPADCIAMAQGIADCFYGINKYTAKLELKSFNQLPLFQNIIAVTVESLGIGKPVKHVWEEFLEKIKTLPDHFKLDQTQLKRTKVFSNDTNLIEKKKVLDDGADWNYQFWLAFQSIQTSCLILNGKRGLLGCFLGSLLKDDNSLENSQSYFNPKTYFLRFLDILMGRDGITLQAIRNPHSNTVSNTDRMIFEKCVGMYSPAYSLDMCPNTIVHHFYGEVLRCDPTDIENHIMHNIKWEHLSSETDMTVESNPLIETKQQTSTEVMTKKSILSETNKTNSIEQKQESIIKPYPMTGTLSQPEKKQVSIIASKKDVKEAWAEAAYKLYEDLKSNVCDNNAYMASMMLGKCVWALQNSGGRLGGLVSQDVETLIKQLVSIKNNSLILDLKDDSAREEMDKIADRIERSQYTGSLTIGVLKNLLKNLVLSPGNAFQQKEKVVPSSNVNTSSLPKSNKESTILGISFLNKEVKKVSTSTMDQIKIEDSEAFIQIYGIIFNFHEKNDNRRKYIKEDFIILLELMENTGEYQRAINSSKGAPTGMNQNLFNKISQCISENKRILDKKESIVNFKNKLKNDESSTVEAYLGIKPGYSYGLRW